MLLNYFNGMITKTHLGYIAFANSCSILGYFYGRNTKSMIKR